MHQLFERYPLQGSYWCYFLMTRQESISRHYFFPWYQGAKKKNCFQNVHFWLFHKRLVSAALSQGAPLKTVTFFGKTWKISYKIPAFHFSVTSSSGGKFNLKIGKIFSELRFSGSPHSQKWCHGLGCSIYCRLCQY